MEERSGAFFSLAHALRKKTARGFVGAFEILLLVVYLSFLIRFFCLQIC